MQIMNVRFRFINIVFKFSKKIGIANLTDVVFHDFLVDAVLFLKCGCAAISDDIKLFTNIAFSNDLISFVIPKII